MSSKLLLINVLIIIIFSFVAAIIFIKTRRIYMIFKSEKYSVQSIKTLDRPSKRAFIPCLLSTISKPTFSFHKKANPIWTLGYCLYHIAIITLVTGYTFSFAIILFRYFNGETIPSFVSQTTGSDMSPLNILVIIFGNAEHSQAHFLFGKYAQLFINATWFDIACAICGNTLLLFTVFAKRMGRISRNIDFSQGLIKISGTSSNQHIVIRVVIFCIIWTEVFARFGFSENFVFAHTFFGVVLFAFLPLLYINHILFFPFSIILNTRKRQIGMLV